MFFSKWRGFYGFRGAQGLLGGVKWVFSLNKRLDKYLLTQLWRGGIPYRSHLRLAPSK